MVKKTQLNPNNMSQFWIRILWVISVAVASAEATTVTDHDDLVREAHERVGRTASFDHYSPVQINVTLGCVSAILAHATSDKVYLDSK